MQETARSNSRALSRTGSPRLGDRVKPGSVLSLFLPKNMPICFSEALNGLEPKALAPCIVGLSLLRLTAAFMDKSVPFCLPIRPTREDNVSEFGKTCGPEAVL